MNATFSNRMNLLSYGSTLENVNGQQKPPETLTPGTQFRNTAKSEQSSITAHFKVNLEVVLCAVTQAHLHQKKGYFYCEAMTSSGCRNYDRSREGSHVTWCKAGHGQRVKKAEVDEWAVCVPH